MCDNYFEVYLHEKKRLWNLSHCIFSQESPLPTSSWKFYVKTISYSTNTRSILIVSRKSLGSLSGGRTLFGKIRIGILDFTVFLIVCYDVLGLSNARKYASDIELSYAFANLFWCRSNFCHEDAGLTSSFLELYLYVGNGICRQLV